MRDPWTLYAVAVAAGVVAILWRYRHQPHARSAQLYVATILALLCALALYQRWW